MTQVLNMILMVEDEPDIQTVARLALETVGAFSVQICGSGREAIDKAPHLQPDLILLDVMMPGMDGPTTLKELKKIQALENTPIIFMSAKVQPQEILEYKALGAIDVIAKPFDPLHLSDHVREIWNRHHAGN